MTMVFAFKFSDYEYFTNKCMSVGIFNQINQVIFVLETKTDFNAIQLSLIPCRHKTGNCKHLFNVKNV